MDFGRADEHDVLRLQREVLGQCKGGGGIGVQLKDLGRLGHHVFSTANHVQRLTIGSLLTNAAGGADCVHQVHVGGFRSEEHTSELQSLMRISYAVFCLKKKNR